MIELFKVASSATNMPSVLLVVLAFSFGVYAVARMLAETYEWAAKMLGPVGRRWLARKNERLSRLASVTELEDQVTKLNKKLAEQRRIIDSQQQDIEWFRQMRDSNYWTKDLQHQITQLALTVQHLRDRVEMTDAYLVADEQWHRQANLAIQPVVCDDCDVKALMSSHVSFLEFERQWNAERGGHRPVGDDEGD